MTCAKQFWKKMYTGWVMSIERQGNQGSTIPDTMCVVPYIAFYVSVCLLYQDSVKFIMILMTPEPCSAHQYLHAPWSTVSDPFTPFLSQCNRITSTKVYLYKATKGNTESGHCRQVAFIDRFFKTHFLLEGATTCDHYKTGCLYRQVVQDTFPSRGSHYIPVTTTRQVAFIDRFYYTHFLLEGATTCDHYKTGGLYRQVLQDTFPSRGSHYLWPLQDRWPLYTGATKDWFDCTIKKTSWAITVSLTVLIQYICMYQLIQSQ